MTVNFELLEKQLVALLEGDVDRLALSANFVALLYAEIPRINWLGVYVVRGDALVLGPFQGLPACVHIPLGQGVCGTAAQNAKTLRVDNVQAFDGHIACDPQSKSELVVPLQNQDQVFAVLDIDSPLEARFSSLDQQGIERLCGRFVQRLCAISPDLTEFI
ncbi:MAG: GAF domain-containing protein [Woeseiaceae bacterium]